MLYMVECGFSDPLREKEWSDWYSGEKLDAVLSVPGFNRSQRFRSLTDAPAPYLAIHEVAAVGTLEGTSYRSVGGGTGTVAEFHHQLEAPTFRWRGALSRSSDGIPTSRCRSVADEYRPDGR